MLGYCSPADLAGSVTMGVADLADAGILFPADPGETVTADVAFLTDDELVTVVVTDLTDAAADLSIWM